MMGNDFIHIIGVVIQCICFRLDSNFAKMHCQANQLDKNDLEFNKIYEYYIVIG